MWMTLNRPVQDGCDILPDRCAKYRSRLEAVNGEYRIPLATIEEMVELYDTLRPAIFSIKRDKAGKLELFAV